MSRAEHPRSTTARLRRAALFSLLCDLAASGDPLPHATDLGGTQPTYDDLRELRLAGLIRSERWGLRRRIQIVATGRWTGWSPEPCLRGPGGVPLPADPEAAFGAAMRGRRYVDLPGYERAGTSGRAPVRQPAYSPSTSSAAWAA